MEILSFILFMLLAIGFHCNGEGEHGLLETSSSDLAEILETGYYVDKTDMIKLFFQPPRMKMITAPRRFGKSTNLDMINRFCEVIVDEKGNRVQTNLTSNYALFSRNNLTIYKYNRVFFENHFGNYPTIYLDFKELDCSSYEDFIDSFKDLIGELYHSHKYLLLSNILDEVEQYKFMKFYDDRIKDLMKERELLRSVKLLTRLLYTHFNKTKCIVLIDEYDVPVQDAIFDAGSDVDKIIGFIKKFISNLLKSNRFVERALISACVRLSGVLTVSANNIKHYPFAETHPFNKYYGLSETEVIDLATKRRVQESMPSIREWYDGYIIGDEKLKIYNVFSIVNYLCTKEFKNYWAEGGEFLKLEKLCLHDEIYNKIMPVLMNKTTEIVAIHKITIQHIIYLRNLVTSPENVKVDSDAANLFINFMLDLGYFTVSNRRSTIIDKRNRTVYTLKFPNREIIDEIHTRIVNIKFFESKFMVSDLNIQLYVKSILNLGSQNSTYEEFGKAVFKLFKEKGFPKNERQLQNPLVTFPWYNDKHFLLVESDFRTRKGKFIDLLIIRKDSTRIIIELKNKKKSAARKKGQTVQNAALEQIVGKENTYYDVFNSFKEFKVRNRIFIGLYLSTNGVCSLSYLYNSTDLSKAVDISIQ